MFIAPFKNTPKTLGFPWVNSFYKIVAAANPPSVLGSTLYVTSDYSGFESKSKYSVISVLLADLDNSTQWEMERRTVRGKFLKNRKMSFKGLNDKYRRRALIPFLSAADSIRGLCITIAIQKQLSNLVGGGNALEPLKTTQPIIAGNWKSNIFDKMFITTFFISLLVAGLAKPNLNIYWISDEDEIFANTTLSQDVAALLSRLTSIQIKYPLGELGVGTTKLDEGDFGEEDFAAIPDLIAGGVSEMITAISIMTKGTPTSRLIYNLPKNLSPKANLISDWLSDNSQNLKRTTVVFDKVENGMKIWRLSTG